MSELKRIVIIGGVAGGASSAARARRLDERCSITMFERGPDISFANCGMPYHIGGVIKERQRLLVQTPQAFSNRYRVQVKTRTEVVRIDRALKQVVAMDLATGTQVVEQYDKLILSPGAEPVRPVIPGLKGEGVFTLRSLADMDAIKNYIDLSKPRSAAIIGGGYIGLEMAEALRHRGLEVELIELAQQVFGPIDAEMAQPLHQHLAMQGVRLHLGTSVTSAVGGDGGFELALSTGKTLKCQLAILAIGVRPEVKLAKEAGLELGPTGGILVDDAMQTSDPDILAVGDAIEVRDLLTMRPALVPLAGPANRQGRIAADNALGRRSVYKHTQGTAICKVFDLSVGMTGLSEKAAKRANVAYEKAYVHPASHASYYPGAAQIALKLLFAPSDGRILGAQAVGTDGVDKRIDVLATAIRANMTVYDLQDLELSYAPPYGSAKDVINYAGFVAANALKGDVNVCHVEDVLSPRPDQQILDVRMPTEILTGTISGSVNVPLDDLRARLGELPRDKELLVFCQVGLRGYLACRILSQNGFKCRNLSGGYKTYQAVVAASNGSQTMPSTEATRELKDDAGAMPEPAEGNRVSCHGPNCAAAPTIARHIDAIGLQCPGPIMRLRKEIDALADGLALTITSSDPSFGPDVAAWCRSTGNQLVEVAPDGRNIRATVIKRTAPAAAPEASCAGTAKNKTIVVFSNDLDRVMAAFIIANGAAAMGSKVTMFFTFWGLNVLRKESPPQVKKSIVERMFGWMMPRGPGKLTLSKMHMGGMGTAMMKGVMASKNVASLPQLIESAKAAGIQLVACTMSMDVMGIKAEELTEGVEHGGVAMYLDQAEAGNVNLFI